MIVFVILTYSQSQWAACGCCLQYLCHRWLHRGPDVGSQSWGRRYFTTVMISIYFLMKHCVKRQF